MGRARREGMVPSPIVRLIPIAMDGGVGLGLMLGERFSIRSLLRLALALSTVGLSGCLGPEAFKFRRTTASGFMKTIEESKDPNARYLAYDKLSSSRSFDNDAQMTRAAQLLAIKLKSGHEPDATRAVICRTLGTLGKSIAREPILTATNDEDALVRAEACRSLGRVGRPEDATVLAKHAMIDTSIECKVAAIESLGDLKAPDPRINKMLVEGMEDPEPVIRVVSLKALRSITGKDLGVEQKPWKDYIAATTSRIAEPPTSGASIPAAAAATLLPENPPEIP
jgi:hypothetical protein